MKDGRYTASDRRSKLGQDQESQLLSDSGMCRTPRTAVMKMFIIEPDEDDYLTAIEISSTYLDFKRTKDRAAAHQLNDFDSRLVLKRLRNSGHKNASRIGVN